VDNPSKYSIFFSFSSFFRYNNDIFHQHLVEILKKSISMFGFVVSRLFPKYIDQFYTEMTSKVISGEIKHRQHVYDGLANSGEAIAAVQKGLNTAKAVIHVADE
jgi:NADPH-dependent curcumin reductase CurA